MSIFKESSFYQIIVAEGLEEGQRIGAQKGMLDEARRLLLRLGQKRLGPVSKRTRTIIEAIDDLKHLERLRDRLFAVSTWGELLKDSE